VNRLLALHGFTQRGWAFEELSRAASLPVDAPDLPGHGDSAVSPDLGSALGWLEEVAGAGPRPLLGYSMGGRLALQFALARPDLVSALVLVSASPGIADAGLRTERRSADAELADRIGEVGVDAFVDEWLARPMFAGLEHRGREWRAADRAMRCTNTATGWRLESPCVWEPPSISWPAKRLGHRCGCGAPGWSGCIGCRANRVDCLAVMSETPGPSRD